MAKRVAQVMAAVDAAVTAAVTHAEALSSGQARLLANDIFGNAKAGVQASA